MKFAVSCWLAASVMWAAGWDAVQRIAPEQKVEVVTKTEHYKGTFVSATDQAVVVRTKAGEQSVAKADVKRVKVADPGKRMRNGLLGTAIGAGAGAGLGFAVCPGCANEGNGAKFVAPMTAAGAGVGALAFLPLPYSTVYASR